MDVRFDSDSKMIKKDAEASEFRNEMSLLMERLVINRHASESEMTHIGHLGVVIVIVIYGCFALLGGQIQGIFCL